MGIWNGRLIINCGDIMIGNILAVLVAIGCGTVTYCMATAYERVRSHFRTSKENEIFNNSVEYSKLFK